MFRFADVEVHCDAMEVTRMGQKITLTAQEFRVLKYFLEHPGRVISRDDLLNGLSQYLPKVVDHLTPDGRLPTEDEVSGRL